MARHHAVAVVCLLAALGGTLAISMQALGKDSKYAVGLNLAFYLPEGGNVTAKGVDAASLVSHPKFDKDLVTVFYMHGYTETPESESLAVVSDAFRKRGGYNLVLVDWSNFAKFPYVKAIFNLFQVKTAVAAAIESMVKAGVPEKNVWLVTHSLGSQLGGAVARELSFRLPRLTALDPAWPGFGLHLVDVKHLSKADADFVDVIHTDAGYYGFATSVGHVDFWPNRGKRVQPSCPPVLKEFGKRYCSHHMSWRFFAESLINEKAFPAVACASWKDFTQQKCAKDAAVVYMGVLADKNKDLTGNFYLTTSDKQPFGKQMSGLQVEDKTMMLALEQGMQQEAPEFSDFDKVDMIEEMKQ